jgi:hypothetical protein
VTNSDNSASQQPPTRPPTDTRRLRQRNERSLFWAVIAFLLVVGGSLIYVIYGRGAFIIGLACLLVGAGLLILLWLIVSIIAWWANR